METRNGTAFTLNLGNALQSKLLTDPAGAKSRLNDRVTKELKAAFGTAPDFAFVMEVSPAGNLHCHGIIDITGNDTEKARGALCRAGGTWQAKSKERFQCVIEPLWNADGWTAYATKHLSRNTKTLTGSPLSISRGLRRETENYWNTMRDKQKSKPKASAPIIVSFPVAASKPSTPAPVAPALPSTFLGNAHDARSLCEALSILDDLDRLIVEDKKSVITD